MNKTYEGTDIPIKVGHIVVVKTGIAYGNSPGTITKVTKVNVPGNHTYTKESIVFCEDSSSLGGNLDLNAYVKTSSYIERISDIRLATVNERRSYYLKRRVKAERGY